MKTLSERNVLLLTQGANVEGNYTNGYFYSEEQMYCDEADTLYDFCQWIDQVVGGASRYNIQKLFLAYMNPDDDELNTFVENLRNKIAEIKNLTK